MAKTQNAARKSTAAARKASAPAAVIADAIAEAAAPQADLPIAEAAAAPELAQGAELDDADIPAFLRREPAEVEAMSDDEILAALAEADPVIGAPDPIAEEIAAGSDIADAPEEPEPEAPVFQRRAGGSLLDSIIAVAPVPEAAPIPAKAAAKAETTEAAKAHAAAANAAKDAAVETCKAALLEAADPEAMIAAIRALYDAGFTNALALRKARAANVQRAPRERGAPSKNAIICEMLQREGGVTRAELLKAAGWPSMSVQDQAKAGGLILTQRKVNGVMIYHGSKPAPAPAPEAAQEAAPEPQEADTAAA